MHWLIFELSHITNLSFFLDHTYYESLVLHEIFLWLLLQLPCSFFNSEFPTKQHVISFYNLKCSRKNAAWINSILVKHYNYTHLTYSSLYFFMILLEVFSNLLVKLFLSIKIYECFLCKYNCKWSLHFLCDTGIV